jgi:hypothetical protein
VFALAASLVSVAIVTPSGAIVAETTLEFVQVPVNEVGIGADGDHNLTMGDGWVSRSNLTQGGEVVGKLVSSCQFAQVRKDGMGGVLQCVNTASLDGGQIATQMRFVLHEGVTTGATAAVTGGTGDYEGVGGSVTSEVAATGETIVTFHLTP